MITFKFLKLLDKLRNGGDKMMTLLILHVSDLCLFVAGQPQHWAVSLHRQGEWAQLPPCCCELCDLDPDTALNLTLVSICLISAISAFDAYE